MAAQDQQDLPTFRRTLENDGYNYEQFRESIRKQLIINRLQQRQVVNRINVTAQEIDNFLANQAQPGNTNTEYHLFHILIATPEAASPEDIAAKQQQAKEVLEKLQKGEDFQKTAKAVSKSRTALTGGDLDWLKEGEMPKVFQPVVAQMKVGDIYGPLRDSNGFHLIKLADKRSASEKSIVVTQNKVQHILIKTSDTVSDFDAQSRLEKLKTRLEGGEDFATLARANSEDTSSAANGGLLDWVNPSELVPEFEEVMNNLQPKQLSKPFKSRYGWHLVQVLERRQHDSTEESLRINATNQIRKRKIDEELQIWLRQLRDEAYVEVKTEVAGGR
jgi:peptidyl-prolyl cis-trans isomerase SurA